jgi:glucan-binding YG repeat protein
MKSQTLVQRKKPLNLKQNETVIISINGVNHLANIKESRGNTYVAVFEKRTEIGSICHISKTVERILDENFKHSYIASYVGVSNLKKDIDLSISKKKKEKKEKKNFCEVITESDVIKKKETGIVFSVGETIYYKNVNMANNGIIKMAKLSIMKKFGDNVVFL